MIKIRATTVCLRSSQVISSVSQFGSTYSNCKTAKQAPSRVGMYLNHQISYNAIVDIYSKGAKSVFYFQA